MPNLPEGKIFFQKLAIIRQSDGKIIDIDTATVNELKIYEDLTFPGILGEINLVDWYDFFKIHEIIAGDKLILQFFTEGEDLLSLEYTIYASKNNIMYEGGNSNFTTFYFCSDWLIKAFGTQYSKFYDNQYIHQIVEDIINYCGTSYKEYEPTLTKYEHFVSPLWTPIHTIKYLLTYTQSKSDKSPAYFLYPDIKTDKLYFKSWNKIIEDGLKNYDEEHPFVIKSKNTVYKNRVFQMSLEDNFDLIQYLNKGFYKQEILNFDEDHKKIYKIDKDVNQYSDLFYHLSRYLPYPKEYEKSEYKTISAIWLYPNRKFVPTNNCYKDMIDAYQKTLYTHLFSSFIKINLFTNGSSDKRVGQMVKVVVPGLDKNKTSINEVMTGAYIIRNILHVFKGNNYYQYLTVVSDGYKILERQDTIKWTGSKIVL